MKTNPLLLIDFYKSTHHEQYPKGLTKMVSYFTPRMSRLEGQDKLVMFGLQAFIKEYLIEYFNEYFFGRPKDEVLNEYSRVLDNTLGKGSYDLNKIADLYDLGYLPLEIRAIPEGSRVDIKVPMIEISNTHPNFVWLVNTIETMMSCTLWHTMLSANVGYNYRNIVNKYYDISVDDNVSRARALGDFSMRGQESVESATKSSAAFCLSFLNTATVPAIPWLELYYNCDCTKEPVAFGAISTEHSVMCSNYAIDGDEVSFVRRLLTEIYPNHSFSMVSDSYDYWNLVDNILPQVKDEILAHNGFISIRGDSGDPVQIVTETVEHLYVKAIYGDSITPQRCRAIYEILVQKGFACNNVSLGVGSFSMQCLEGFDGHDITFKPYTRDTYGIAVKATYAEDKDGNPIMIFKNPKTDTGKFKKSQRGCCTVHFDGEKFSYTDGLTFAEHDADMDNYMSIVFRDGKTVNECSLSDVRSLLWLGDF